MLALSDITSFDTYTLREIGERVGIPTTHPQTIKASVEKLVSIGLLERNETGHFSTVFMKEGNQLYFMVDEFALLKTRETPLNKILVPVNSVPGWITTIDIQTLKKDEDMPNVSPEVSKIEPIQTTVEGYIAEQQLKLV